MKPLFMWAGGKNKMISKYLGRDDWEIFPDTLTHYVEPFFGGGAVFLHMLPTIHKQNAKVTINDVNTEIMQLYSVIQTNVEELIAELKIYENEYLAIPGVVVKKPKGSPRTKPFDPNNRNDNRKVYFLEQRRRYGTDLTIRSDKVKESALLYFLMRTAFNGIWQTTKESQGRFATPAGLLNHEGQVFDYENIRLWNEALQDVNILCGDWKVACDTVKENGAYFFFDPPYRDSFANYNTTFGDDRQAELIRYAAAKASKNKVALCNRWCGDDFYDQHCGDLTILEFDVTYTAGVRATDTTGKKGAKAAKEIVMI